MTQLVVKSGRPGDHPKPTFRRDVAPHFTRICESSAVISPPEMSLFGVKNRPIFDDFGGVSRPISREILAGREIGVFGVVGGDGETMSKSRCAT